jgi:hypothetical protein
MTALTLALGGALGGALRLVPVEGFSQREPRRGAHATYATSRPWSLRNEKALMQYDQVRRVGGAASRPGCAQGCRAGSWPTAHQISRQVATRGPWTGPGGAAADIRDCGGPQ